MKIVCHFIFTEDAVIKSAKIVSAEWDDHMQVKIDNTQIFAHIDGEYRDPGYGSPRNGLERKTSNKLQEPIDVTEQVKNQYTMSQTMKLKCHPLYG